MFKKKIGHALRDRELRASITFGYHGEMKKKITGDNRG